MKDAASPTGTWLITASAGLLLGTALQLQQAALAPMALHAACIAIGLAMLAAVAWAAARASMAAPGRHPWAAQVAMALALTLAAAAIGFGSAGGRAQWRLSRELPVSLEGVDLQVTGVVAGLPQRTPEAWRFRFEVESARRDGEPVALPEQLALGWYADARAPLPTTLRAGQRWQLAVRLKRPHGVLNPHGFDYELLLFEQGVRATGSVRTAPASLNRWLADGAAHPVDRARQAVREAIFERLAGPTPAPQDAVGDAASGNAAASRAAGLLAALSVGDQAAIDRDDWALYRNTGVAHLMSISGLHVTMFAWLFGLAAGWFWRRSARLMLACPAPQAARWAGLAAALAYAVFAGWGVPAQRTVMMLATVTVMGALGLRWRWPLVWGTALLVVVLIDPWALLQPGFWLSFAAVGLLMGSSLVREAPTARARDEARTAWAAASQGLEAPPAVLPAGRRAAWVSAGREALRTQAVATLGLAPLTLVFFQQLSLVGFAANLIAIPLVTLVITPLALLGALLPPLWTPAAWAADGLHVALQALAAPAWAVWSVPAAPAWAVAAALLGSALALLPLPWRLRALAVPLVLPLLLPPVVRPAPGQFELMAIDVGQGTAVLLRTAQHTLLYDTGPQYSRESDAGERVIVPLLRALGDARLDRLMLSHRDTDHVGGAAAVLQAVPVVSMWSSLESGHRLRHLAASRGVAVDDCLAGQAWEWDGVRFEVLHPGAERLAQAETVKTKPNTLSCVLRVQAAGPAGERARSVLLTGDLEREQELALVSRHGDALRSEVLVVPHHGSKTSSSAAFLDAVAPRVAVVQAGYRNRFGHPAAEVVQRYDDRGIRIVDSPRCGAWQSRIDATGQAAETCWRREARRYWHHPDITAPENGVEVANPASEATATDAVVP